MSCDFLNCNIRRCTYYMNLVGTICTAQLLFLYWLWTQNGFLTNLTFLSSSLYICPDSSMRGCVPGSRCDRQISWVRKKPIDGRETACSSQLIPAAHSCLWLGMKTTGVGAAHISHKIIQRHDVPPSVYQVHRQQKRLNSETKKAWVARAASSGSKLGL